MTSSMACPCGVAVLGIVEAATGGDAIAAYERAAFQALAVGAQFYARRHDADASRAGAGEEIDEILRRLRIALALMEKQVSEYPPARQSPETLAGYLRSWAHTTSQITAQLYRQAAHQDVSTSADRLDGAPAAPGSTTNSGQ